VNNSDPSLIRPNPAGAYTLYIYIAETLQPSGARDSSGAVTTVKFVPTAGAPATFAASPRDVITQGACDSCHVKTQAHGGGRADPQGCFSCHNVGGMDRTVGAQGINCTLPTDCPGYHGGTPGLSWETCTAGKCTITQDPTPNQTVQFGPLMHMLHFARLLDGYAERANLVTPGLQVVGFNNTVNNFSEVLFPQDIRNCTKCHGDTNAACSSSAPCGYGQTCAGSACVNTAWQATGSKVCLACHDSGAAYAHAQLNTGTVSGTAVETCEVCHGMTAEFSVAKVHSIRSPYVPPYLRQKE
jgi:OmcA/MtrC family decaheme c-type cytochrome